MGIGGFPVSSRILRKSGKETLKDAGALRLP
jgi:hypothetical protein